MDNTNNIAVAGMLIAIICTVDLPQARSQDHLAKTIVVSLPDSSSYKVHRDIRYHDDDDGRELLMDVFYPAANDGRVMPAVLFVHGGPLPESVAKQGKDLGQYQSIGAFVTGAGIAGIAFSHGFTGVNAFQTASNDVQSAIAFVRDQASNLHVDPDRMCLMHISAGGTFLAPILEDRPAWLRCVVLYYPVLRPDVMEELGAGEVSNEQATSLNPFLHLTAYKTGAPALLIVEAGADSPILNADLRRFRDEAIDAGWRVEYWNHPTGPHGFDVFDSSLRSRRVLHRTRDFLREFLIED